MSILVFDTVHRAYRRGHDVLKGVSFTAEAGQVVGLVGANGAGKTTLLRIAMGMLEPQRGSVRVFGLDPRRQPVEVKRRVGYVAESQILPPFLRARQVLDLHRELFPTWDAAMADELSGRFALPLDDRIKHLSKGQARQVALLCAVAHRPELLLLDEPAGGLDPAARRGFLETSIQLLNECGSTIVFSSHYMTDVERLADRIVMIHHGSVLIDTDLDALQESYSLALVRRDRHASRDSLLALGPCLGVRERGDTLHAVFALEPHRVRELLQRELGVEDAHCTRIALEEMFVELAGGNGA